MKKQRKTVGPFTLVRSEITVSYARSSGGELFVAPAKDGEAWIVVLRGRVVGVVERDGRRYCGQRTREDCAYLHCNTKPIALRSHLLTRCGRESLGTFLAFNF